jgi:signal transduction histidine kinase
MRRSAVFAGGTRTVREIVSAIVPSLWHVRLSLLDTLSLVSLITLLGIVGMTAWVTVGHLRKVAVELDQLIHLDLAVLLKGELMQPMEPHNQLGLEERITAFERRYPRFDFYIIDRDGRVLVSSRHTRREVRVHQISPEPIMRLLHSGRRTIPALGQDPRHPGVSRTFTVAQLDPPMIDRFLYGVAVRPGPLSAILGEAVVSRTLREYRANMIAILCAALLVWFGRALVVAIRPPRAGRTRDAALIDEVREADVTALAAAVTEVAQTLRSKAKGLSEREEERIHLVNHVSHDLRATLSTMLERLSLFAQQRGRVAEESLRELGRDTDTVISAVNEILDLVRYECLGDDLEKEDFPALEYVQDVALQCKGLAQERGVVLVHTLQGGGPKVWGDVSLIYEAYQRAVENAIASSNATDTVTLIAAEDDSHSYLSVQDARSGTAREDLVRIFNPLVRRESIAHNTGLGLYMVKRIVDAHGGEVIVTTDEDRETKVTLQFPKATLGRDA